MMVINLIFDIYDGHRMSQNMAICLSKYGLYLKISDIKKNLWNKTFVGLENQKTFFSKSILCTSLYEF